MAFRKKASQLAQYQADIIVIPECEDPEKLAFINNFPSATSQLWFGTNKHKGLGVFSYGTFKLSVLGNHDPRLRTIIPILVTNGRRKFYLLAIWANNPTDKGSQYVEQVWKALHHYDALFKKQNVLLIGDFNSNSIWDKQHRRGNHSDVVEYLKKKNIRSCYHDHHSQEQGTEKHPTFYLYRHQDKSYHIDYCFASKKLLS